jgi:type II secretory pathway component GspD/PulD (secretin)
MRLVSAGLCGWLLCAVSGLPAWGQGTSPESTPAAPAAADPVPATGASPPSSAPATDTPPEGRGPGGAGGFGGPGFGGPGGGRGGFGGGRGGVLGEVLRSEVQAELKLTEEQVTKAREISEAQRGQFDPSIFQKLQAAQTDEERQKLMAEMQASAEKLRLAAEEQFKAVVTPEQFARLRQLAWQRQGAAALVDDAIAAELKLSPEQVTQLKTIVDESRQVAMSRGFRVSREEREQARAELETKLLAVLTDEQKSAWTTKLGAPAPTPPERPEGRGPGDRGPGGFAGFPPAGGTPAGGTPPGAPLATPTAPSTVPGAGPGSVPAVPASTPGQPAPADSAPPVAVVVDGQKKLTFNFRFAPWELVLKWFAEQADLTLDLSATPPGTFNYYDNGQYTVTEALDVLNGYLLQKGYILVRRDRFLVSLNIDNGIPPNLIPQVALEELETRGKNELISIVLPLDGTDAETAAADIKELLGPQGKVVPLKKTNRLFITDIGGNLRKMYALLSASGSVSNGSRTFRSFTLKEVTPLEADRMLRDLFGLPARTASGAVVATPMFPNWRPEQGGRDDRDRGRSGGGGGGEQPQPGQPGQAPGFPQAMNRDQMQIAIDARTNSLLVTAKPEEMVLVEQAIKTLDVPGSRGGAGQAQLEVYPLQTADTRSVVEMLNTLLPGMKVTEDTKSRRVSVFALPDEQRQVREIVKQLDGTASENVTVIGLRRLDPVAAAQSLKSLFSSNRSDAPSIEADAQGRRIMVRGSSDQVSQVKALLAQMGEDGNSTGGSGAGGLRTIPLGGRDSQQVLTLLEQLWPKEEASPLRIVVPSALSPTRDGARRERMRSDEGEPSGPIRRVLTPEPNVAPVERRIEPARERSPVESGEEAESDPEALEELEETSESEPAAAQPSLADELKALLGDEPAGQPAEDAEMESEVVRTPAAGEGSPVVIAPNGGSLIVTSDDEAALDRVEKLIGTLLQAAPARTKWTVFYLRTADATETATILGNLFPQGTVSKSDSGSGLFGGLGSSLSALGSSGGAMTGLNSLSNSSEALRIVAEPRSNALFVAGPADTVDQIEATLKVLDANELPESFRERVPRQIVVEHADVEKVAEVVKEVYKEQLEVNPLAALAGGGNRGGGGGFNPLAMMMGGMAGGGNQKAPKVQMTLAVDDRTNTLIVSASETLFKQVEAMVKTIDLAAKEAKATVRVVPLTTTNGAIISQALGAMVPKIKVTSSSAIPSGPSGTSRSSGGSSFSPPSGTDGGTDPIRAMFEQRMRERMMEGGGFRGGFPVVVPSGGDGGSGRRRRE